MIHAWNLGYEKSKNRAKELYIKIGRIQSPALDNEYISFNNKGFNHLIRKGRLPRTRNEQKRRFVLLQYVEDIIKNPKARIEYREIEAKHKENRYGEKVIITSMARFWTFSSTIDFCRIKVVIRQTKKSKYFFSVMGDDNVKISKKVKKRKIKKLPKK